MHDRWREPEQGSGLITVPKFVNRLTRPFRRAGRMPRAAWRASAKKSAASARNLWARRAASPAPPSQPTGDPADGNAGAAPPPILKARSRARASALHKRQSTTPQTGLERKTMLSAMDASVSRTTARREAPRCLSYPSHASASSRPSLVVRQRSHKTRVYVKDNIHQLRRKTVP
jgi:hypothetical protein